MKHASSYRDSDSRSARKRTLLPGVLLPALGYLGGALGLAFALVVVVVHPGPGNGSLSYRIDAEIPLVMGWLVFKSGSQRIVLDQDKMRIYTWGLCWRVPRGAVREVELRLRCTLSVAVVLTDGYRIRPTTFAVRRGIGYGNPKFMNRSGIQEAIVKWNSEVQTERPVLLEPGRRYWQVRRDDLLVLAVAGLVVLLLAVTLSS